MASANSSQDEYQSQKRNITNQTADPTKMHDLSKAE